MTAITTCRLLDGKLNRCTAEVADAEGEILLCVSHLAAALQLINRRMPANAIRTAPTTVLAPRLRTA